MLSAVQRVLGRNRVFSPPFIIMFNETGNSGRVKLASLRIGLLSMKATAARASAQLLARTGVSTWIP